MSKKEMFVDKGIIDEGGGGCDDANSAAVCCDLNHFISSANVRYPQHPAGASPSASRHRRPHKPSPRLSMPERPLLMFYWCTQSYGGVTLHSQHIA